MAGLDPPPHMATPQTAAPIIFQVHVSPTHHGKASTPNPRGIRQPFEIKLLQPVALWSYRDLSLDPTHPCPQECRGKEPGQRHDSAL